MKLLNMGYDAVCADMDGQLHPDVKTEQRQLPVRQNKGGTMKKESNLNRTRRTAVALANRTRRTAVALALLLSFAAPQALRGNLGIYAPTCGGCGECPACTADKDSGADGPSGFSRLLDLIRGYVASVLEPPRIFNNTRTNVPLAASATVGSLRLTCAFGNAREALGGPGRFTVRSITPSPLLWTPAMLRHSDPLLSRIARVELPREASAGLRAGDASRCPVVTGDFYASQHARRVVVLDADGEQVAFAFRNGQSEGLPAGAQSTRLLRMVMRDASGGATSSAPAWYDLLYPNGDVLRHDASTGDAAWLRTKDGRVHTAASRGLEAVRDAGGRLRQVRSDADGLADIVPDADGTGYEIRLYPPAQCGAKAAQTGFFTVSGAPASALRVWCPDTRLGVRIDIRKTVGGAETDHWRFEYSHQREGWLEVRQDGGTASSQSTVWSRSRMVKWVTLAERAADGSTASRTEQTVRRFPFGERTVRLVRDPGGADLATVWTYGEHEASQGGYGRVHTVAHPDGGWEELGYDGHGRLARRATPWKDADPGDLEEFPPDPEDVREERFSYSAVDARDTVSANDARPRTEEVRARGVVVSRVYHAYYVENGRPVEVLERCRRPDAAYGAADSLRTVAVSYPAGDASSSASAGRLHTVLHPGGLLDTYEYEYGSYAPSADGPGVFTPGAGAFLRTTATRGTAASPAGVAGRTLRSVAVSDAAGCVLLEETRLYTGVAYELLSWTVRAYDASHRQVSELKSDGEVTETAWSCCSKASETSADGRTATYAYDALHRLTHVVLWSGGAPAHTTEYAYDAAGHVLSRTVSGGGLSLSAASAYDLAGRLVSSTDEAGLSTARAYSRAAGSGNVETVTRPGGATTVTSYYRDGRVKSVTGTAQVAEHYDYGVNADGSQWTLVRAGAPASPRWTRTTTDMLGNVVKVEKPGYGANAVVATVKTYDAAGRLVKTTQTNSPDVLYEYDALGELFRTGRDADGNGILDLASDDRVTETASSYLQDNDNAWWARSMQSVYATANDATPTTVSTTEERLSGFADGVVSETRETDVHGNTSVTTVSVDRANATVTTEKISPESSVALRQVTVDGLVVSVRSKSDLTTTFGYDGLRRRVSGQHDLLRLRQCGAARLETERPGQMLPLFLQPARPANPCLGRRGVPRGIRLRPLRPEGVNDHLPHGDILERRVMAEPRPAGGHDDVEL